MSMSECDTVMSRLNRLLISIFEQIDGCACTQPASAIHFQGPTVVSVCLLPPLASTVSNSIYDYVLAAPLPALAPSCRARRARLAFATSYTAALLLFMMFIIMLTMDGNQSRIVKRKSYCVDISFALSSSWDLIKLTIRVRIV